MEADVFEILGNSARGDGVRRKCAAAASRFELGGCEDGIEDERGRDVVRYVELVNFFVAFDVLIQPVDHHLPILGGKRHVGDGRSFVDHFDRDFVFVIGKRPQHAWNQRRAQSKSRNRLQGNGGGRAFQSTSNEEYRSWSLEQADRQRKGAGERGCG